MKLHRNVFRKFCELILKRINKLKKKKKKKKKKKNSGEQEKESIIHVRVGEKKIDPSG